ncbi:MAG: hypothetical protein ABR903_09455 [Thermodesulfovibrionales bacterium]
MEAYGDLSPASQRGIFFFGRSGAVRLCVTMMQTREEILLLQGSFTFDREDRRERICRWPDSSPGAALCVVLEVMIIRFVGPFISDIFGGEGFLAVFHEVAESSYR